MSDRPRRRVRGGFDSTADNRFTANHYADASLTDLNSQIYGNRLALVKRCVYEYRNNTYAKGIVDGFANHIVGRHGPTLQMSTGRTVFDQSVEDRWAKYTKKLDSRGRQNLGAMLRTDIKNTCIRGEALAVKKTAKNAPDNEPRLRVLNISPDRIATPMTTDVKNVIDGIQIDPDTGRPIAYAIYATAQNSTFVSPSEKFEWERADQVFHFYLDDEAEQVRGYPALQSALPVLAYLRRFTLATVSAAEQAANISAVIYSTLSQVDNELVEAMDEIEIPRNAMLTLPSGWDARQMEAKHPNASYKEFKTELIAEAARCLLMPYLVAAGNAAGYNYSSGRLDMQEMWTTHEIVQDMLAFTKVDPIFRAWLAEGMLIPGYFKGVTSKLRATPIDELTRSWNWTGQRHVDPLKEASAAATRLESNTTTLATEYAKEGKDWEIELEQRIREQAREAELRKKYGLEEGGDKPRPNDGPNEGTPNDK